MDLTAMAMCLEHGIDISVFKLDKPENIIKRQGVKISEPWW